MDAETKRAIWATEQAIIGSVLIQSSDEANWDCINELREVLKPDDFYSDQHKRIYHSMLQCRLLPPNQIVVAAKMNELRLLHNGDCASMSLCVAMTPCSLDYSYYAECLKSYRVYRRDSTVKGVPW